MTDHELLELAAKAAGFRRDFQWNCRFLPSAGGSVLCGNSWTKWNPLEDDGDALRLAEKLGLTICMNGTKSVSAFDEYNKNVFATEYTAHAGSRIQATRRAIVRVAAEVGKQMP